MEYKDLRLLDYILDGDEVVGRIGYIDGVFVNVRWESGRITEGLTLPDVLAMRMHFEAWLGAMLSILGEEEDEEEVIA